MYIAKESIIKDGIVYGPDAEIELTNEQAEYLGEKVEKKSARKTNKKDEEGDA